MQVRKSGKSHQELLLASSSSPPRPKRKGSPPFSRTTRLPFFASSARTWLIFSWGIVWWPARFPIDWVLKQEFWPIPVLPGCHKITSFDFIHRQLPEKVFHPLLQFFCKIPVLSIRPAPFFMLFQLTIFDFSIGSYRRGTSAI